MLQGNCCRGIPALRHKTRDVLEDNTVKAFVQGPSRSGKVSEGYIYIIHVKPWTNSSSLGWEGNWQNLTQRNHHPNRRVDPLCRFSTIHGRYKQTDGRTDSKNTELDLYQQALRLYLTKRHGLIITRLLKVI